jgi:hypothetical protein
MFARYENVPFFSIENLSAHINEWVLGNFHPWVTSLGSLLSACLTVAKPASATRTFIKTFGLSCQDIPPLLGRCREEDHLFVLGFFASFSRLGSTA